MQRKNAQTIHFPLSLRIGLMAGMVAIMTSGCHAGDAIGNLLATRPPYPVTSSGLAFSGRIGTQPIYWVDNDRVLFPGYAMDRRKVADGTLEPAKPAVFIWNLKTNTHERHADLATPSYSMCFNHGFIGYATGFTGEDDRGYKYIIKAGMLGQEKELPRDIFWKLQPELKQCIEPKAEVRPEHRQDAGIRFLRAEDGYLFTGKAKEPGGHVIHSENQNDPVKFYKTGKSEPIVLPILPKEAFQVEPYSEYGKQYLIIPNRPKSGDINGPGGPWPAGTAKPIYLLSSDGHVDTLMVPPGPWQGMNKAFLTAKGIFIVSNNATGANSRNAGGYLLHDGKVTKLFDQLVDGAGVSPNGCRIAYAVNDFNPETTEFVQVMDLCK